jgi:hypothetical protein
VLTEHALCDPTRIADDRHNEMALLRAGRQRQDLRRALRDDAFLVLDELVDSAAAQGVGHAFGNVEQHDVANGLHTQSADLST